MKFSYQNDPKLHFEIMGDAAVTPRNIDGHDGYDLKAPPVRINQPDKFDFNLKFTLLFEKGSETQERTLYHNHSRRKPLPDGTILGPYEVGKIYDNLLTFFIAQFSGQDGSDMPLESVRVEAIP